MGVTPSLHRIPPGTEKAKPDFVEILPARVIPSFDCASYAIPVRFAHCLFGFDSAPSRCRWHLARFGHCPNFSRIGLDGCCLGSLPYPVVIKLGPERIAGFSIIPGPDFPAADFSRIGLDGCCLGFLPDPVAKKLGPERVAGFSIIPGPDFPAAAIELRACMLELRPSSDELRIPSISRSASIGNANRQEGITLGEGVPIARTPSNH